MRTKYIELIDNVAEGILFAAGVNDAKNGISPEAPESSISAYYRGRKSCEPEGIGVGLGKAMCGTPQ